VAADGSDEAQDEVGSADVAALREELEDEKMANAQLEERLKTLRRQMAEAASETADTPEAPVEEVSDASQNEGQGADLAALDAELHQLRAANAELEASIAALREANAQGVGDPHLINKAMMAELESLRASRKVEAAEAQAVLGALEPLLTQATGEAQ
jgi:cell division protein FtsB